MKKTNYLAIFVIFTVVYLAITFSIPPDPVSLARYNITVLQSRLISLTIALPLLAIWFSAFYGFAKLRDYAQSIKDSSDGASLQALSRGLMVLALGLPISSIVSSSLNYAARLNPSWLPGVVITNNYLSLVIAALGFTWIARGAAGLASLIKIKHSLVDQLLPALVFLLLAGTYLYFVLQNPYRTAPGPTGRSTYFLPDWLIVLTISLPYLYVWFSGLRAATNIALYKNNVQGVIYKQFLKYLAVGLTAVIVSSISVQFLGALSALLINLSLGPILLLIYALLIIIAVGYVLIAAGAKKLQKLEEV